MPIIESLIQRTKGTQVLLGATTYDFQPDKNGRHVCKVDDATHAEKLLSIREGYREFNAKDKAPDQLTAEQKAAETERLALFAEHKQKFNRDAPEDISTEDLRTAIAEGTGA